MQAGVEGFHVLGLDVGAASLSVAEVDSGGRVVRSFYTLHGGDGEGCLRAFLSHIDGSVIRGLAATSGSPDWIRADGRFNDQICTITAARTIHPEARSILTTGAERSGLVRFDQQGDYRSFSANPACAAGTGGFLDQQARRLNLAGAEALARLALLNQAPPPKIASRCAVFAKTDLVHAQQEGHSLEAICDGLCRGVARNMVDTLIKGDPLHGPLLMVGGVARNQAVVRHLRQLLDVDVIADGSVPYGALGAALKLIGEADWAPWAEPREVEGFIRPGPPARAYERPPLTLRLSRYPDFTSLEKTSFHGRLVAHSHPLEVDLYQDPSGAGAISVFLGIDIGSTSTKAVLTDAGGGVLAGFYTATAGRPLQATQLILEAIEDLQSSKEVRFDIMGVGTTGAGRKFIGRILGADLILDEITAHARAATELHPNVDTIIEIGGQDSKFTTLKNGLVTLSVMNNVCAAGTGSFIEEQARRLGVPLSEYAARTRTAASPMASERCTVFMERDLNHYLNQGYTTGEVLAAVLHSVRENYLNKVAVEGAIGDTVVFQGATARNPALVAAFEQRIGKPILVSGFCHLTGALGAALTLRDEGAHGAGSRDEGAHGTGFRGTGLCREAIPVRSETCDYCTNHCKLTVATVAGETVAYGFLCGRDYETPNFVRNDTSGFDLFKERRRAFPALRSRPPRSPVTVGIPAALHLVEDLPLWIRFFHRLGIRTVTSESYAEAVTDGRLLAGAELCAPMTALHAHVKYLTEKADYVFLPFYLEKKAEEKGVRRQLCYYTQFAPSVGIGAGGQGQGRKILTPLVFSLYNRLLAKAELYRTLRPLVPGGLSPLDVSAAFDEAQREKDEGLARLKEVYRREVAGRDGIHVVLLGHPYTVLSKWMNKGIPDTFSALGVPVFYQDMLSYSPEDLRAIQPILHDIHWHYGARILEAAEVTALTPGAYPVLLTSFKCAPDSFVTDYVRQILEAHDKPYLVLQLDEHDSRLGYETRIESAVRAFRNHARGDGAPGRMKNEPPVVWATRPSVDLTQKTILFPNWDPVSLRLLVAAVRKSGRDARLLETSEGSMRRSLRHNSGQCTPLNIIAQDFMEYVEGHDLDPGRTVLWMVASSVACNIRLYPHHIRTIFRSRGDGYEDAEVFAGALSLQDISPTLSFDAYLAYMFGGFLQRMGCRIRPYERAAGDTDRVLEDGVRLLERAFFGDGSKEDALARVVSSLQAVKTFDVERKPKVAIFGDLYSRDNRVMNQDLVHFIEAHGGEVITTPYTSYAKMVVRPYYWKWFLEGRYMNVVSTKAYLTALHRLEKKYFRHFEKILRDPEPSYDASPQEILSEYNVRVEHTGEAMDNLLKVFYMVRHHPDLSLFVQASPAFCCPSLITEAMAREIEAKSGVPVVSVTYDGTGGAKNDIILPYLEYPQSRKSGSESSSGPDPLRRPTHVG